MGLNRILQPLAEDSIYDALIEMSAISAVFRNAAPSSDELKLNVKALQRFGSLVLKTGEALQIGGAFSLLSSLSHGFGDGMCSKRCCEVNEEYQ